MDKVIKSFRMGDLCEYIKVRKAQKKNVRTEKSHEFCIPVVYAKFGDNGIMYWGRKGEFDTHSNVISIVYNGAIAAGKVYAQEEETGILAEAYLVRVKNGETIPFRSIQYLAFSIEKVIYPKYSRDLLATWENRVENDIIPLPVQTDAEGSPIIDPERKYHAEGYIPDWSYMQERVAELEQERVAELEQERIAELEQYLVAAGLNDYELNDEDNAVLNRCISFKEFVVGNIFHKIESKFYGHPNSYTGRKAYTKTSPDKEHTIPLTCAKMGDNGIMYYGKTGMFSAEPNCLAMIRDGAVSTGLVYAQDQPTGVLSHSYLMRCNDEVEFEALLYCASVMTKALYPLYSRDNPSLWTGKVEKNMIPLPIQTNEEGTPIIDPERKYHAEGYIPDWDYMTSYIRAMKKVVIADVVKYKDEVIAKTCSLVSAK